MIIRNSLTRYWLLIGVGALAIAGLFALVLVIARTPSLSDIPLFATLFHEALVVHVDLSVLVWFLSIACLMWSLHSQHSRPFIPYMEEAALISFALGTLAIAASPFDPKGEALMSNYIPTITSPIFFLGLALLLCGVGLMVAKYFCSLPHQLATSSITNFAVRSSLIIAAVAIGAFFWSFKQMPHDLSGEGYYEQLFWGGGHVLQFLHVQIVMIVWLMLTKALKPEFSIYQPHLVILFSIGLICSLCVPFAYLHYTADNPSQKIFFTYLMIGAGGIAPTILALWILPGMLTFTNLRHGENRALYSALFMSLVLFIYGNILGALIQGQNVVIPAHYHGSIVGVTLAFMGAAYMLLPQFGYKNVGNWGLAFWQPIVYGGGQLLHISGLAWSGGYGVLRKTPGGMNDLATSVKIAMGFMGIGGFIAIIGGLMFVVVVWKSYVRDLPKAG